MMSWKSDLQLALVLLGSIATFGLVGCAGGGGGTGALRIQSRGIESLTLPSNFTTAIYTETDENVASFYLSDAPLESILDGTIERGQIVHIELLWLPKPGRTPVDSSATNISIRHIILADGEFGVYGGAGFARASGRIGKSSVSLRIPEASLALLESSEGFADRLTPATLTGSLTAVRDPQGARRVGRATSQIITDLLGRPRYVRTERIQTKRALTDAG